MQVIKLDASTWRTIEDFLTALRTAIGAPDWHGWSVNAFTDSMITGDVTSVEPPYEVRIVGSEKATREVQEHIAVLAGALDRARAEKRRWEGVDTEVSLQLAGAIR